LKLPAEAIAIRFRKVRALAEIAASCGARLAHVKPMGRSTSGGAQSGDAEAIARVSLDGARCSAGGAGWVAYAESFGKRFAVAARRSPTALRAGWNSTLEKVL